MIEMTNEKGKTYKDTSLISGQHGQQHSFDFKRKPRSLPDSFEHFAEILVCAIVLDFNCNFQQQNDKRKNLQHISVCPGTFVHPLLVFLTF